MRKISQIIFLLLYFVSSYTATQKRTRVFVAELAHSSRDGQLQMDSACEKLAGGYPFYREAKPNAGSATLFHTPERMHFFPAVSEHSFYVQSHSLKSLYTFETVASRAPPTHSSRNNSR